MSAVEELYKNGTTIGRTLDVRSTLVNYTTRPLTCFSSSSQVVVTEWKPFYKNARYKLWQPDIQKSFCGDNSARNRQGLGRYVVQFVGRCSDLYHGRNEGKLITVCIFIKGCIRERTAIGIETSGQQEIDSIISDAADAPSVSASGCSGAVWLEVSFFFRPVQLRRAKY